VGKNNVLRALKELKAEGLSFNLTYSRGPFFLRGSQKEIDADNASMGLPKDASNLQTTRVRCERNPEWAHRVEHMQQLMAEAGLSPRNKAVTDHRIMRDTMPAHRLAQYAAKHESNEKGERMWFALSRRWFMGKDILNEADILPVRLDGRELLEECAQVAGLNMDNVRKVLDGDQSLVSEAEIVDQVRQVHAVGIHSIPQIVFEVEGLTEGSWRQNPALPEGKYRHIHHGSGSKAAFKALLQQLHGACVPAGAA